MQGPISFDHVVVDQRGPLVPWEKAVGDIEYFLRSPRAVHLNYGPWVSEPIPMRKLPTGEPCAGEPHARFGGRGRREPFPTPIGLRIGNLLSAASCGNRPIDLELVC